MEQHTASSLAPQPQQVGAPYSATAARLIEQLQAEARAATLDALSAGDDIIVLHALDPATRRVRLDDDGDLTITDDRGAHYTAWRRWEEPEGWRASLHMAGHWHPALWYVNETLVDGQGRPWDRRGTVCVMDDFGFLVEVQR